MNESSTLLLVDDTESDLFLMRRAFKMAQCDIPVQEVHNGEEAIAYLMGEGVFADRTKFPLPIVMILDLNMPKKDGFAVLTWVRSQPVLRRLAIIVLSASMRSQDVERAFDLGANSFLVKPSNLEVLSSMIRCLGDWIQMNHFPSLSVAKREMMGR